MKIRMILMALAALLCLASCSDDDSGIQLTEDEVTGDIITGKQIVINTKPWQHYHQKKLLRLYL